MKLWMSAEMFDDVADAYRKRRNNLEKAFNRTFLSRDYGEGVTEWAFVAIILPPEIEGYTEYRRYHKDERSIEFRLRIDYFKFRNGGEHTQMRMVCEGLSSALDRLNKNPIPNFDHLRLKDDFLDFCRKRKWM